MNGRYACKAQQAAWLVWWLVAWLVGWLVGWVFGGVLLVGWLVGRVIRRFGNGRNEVCCQVGNNRQCVIRGLLRKKGQVFIDIDSMVVVSLRNPLESSSDDEGLGQTAVSDKDTSDIIGLLNVRHIEILRGTNINKIIFSDSKGAEDTDIFDRSDQVNEIVEAKDDLDIDAI